MPTRRWNSKSCLLLLLGMGCSQRCLSSFQQQGPFSLENLISPNCVPHFAEGHAQLCISMCFERSWELPDRWARVERFRALSALPMGRHQPVRTAERLPRCVRGEGTGSGRAVSHPGPLNMPRGRSHVHLGLCLVRSGGQESQASQVPTVRDLPLCLGLRAVPLGASAVSWEGWNGASGPVTSPAAAMSGSCLPRSSLGQREAGRGRLVTPRCPPALSSHPCAGGPTTGPASAVPVEHGARRLASASRVPADVFMVSELGFT